MGAPDFERLVADQIDYYRKRAPEYDRWFLRQGRFHRGREHTARWFRQVEEVRSALADFGAAGRVLELACGTGLWTEQLVATADELTAVDASREMIAVNRARLGDRPVRYVRANLFDWTPDAPYDAVFFSFWLSHVPPPRFAWFWEWLRGALAPGGRVFFVDSLRHPLSTARDQHLGRGVTQTRRLDDGRLFEIVKVFHTPDELAPALTDLGWSIDVRATADFFLHGSGRVAD